MKRLAVVPLILLLGAVATLLARAASSPSARAAGAQTLPPAASAGQVVLYGHVKSLTRKNGRFELRFDPAWWLTGLTARRAKLEDTGSSDVPNDYYIVEQGHRLLSYVVSPTARATVLVNGAGTATVPVAELAQIVAGRNPRHRPLSEPKAGFWIRVGAGYPSPVLELDQQFQP
jgi:hypothetical protein